MDKLKSMPNEIERKFLVLSGWRQDCKVYKLCSQGFIFISEGKTVRVRVVDNKGFVTIKGKTHGIERLEFEYEIPLQDANEMLAHLCEKPLIEKKRYYYEYDGHLWEVDEFLGDNEGLVIAEIELTSLDEQFKKPKWIGKEVSHDPKYYNASLVKNSFKTWKST